MCQTMTVSRMQLAYDAALITEDAGRELFGIYFSCSCYTRGACALGCRACEDHAPASGRATATEEWS